MQRIVFGGRELKHNIMIYQQAYVKKLACWGVVHIGLNHAMGNAQNEDCGGLILPWLVQAKTLLPYWNRLCGLPPARGGVFIPPDLQYR